MDPTFTFTFGSQSTSTGSSITKNGNGTLTTAISTAFTGGFTLNAGTVNIGGVNAIGAGTLTINGGTLQSNSGTARSPAVTSIVVGGDFTIGGANTGALTFAAPVDLGGATRQITDDNTTSSTVFSGVISNGGLTKLGNGQLNLTGTSNNTYTGLTTVSAGTLGLGKSATINAFGGDLTINGGAVLYSAANNDQIIDSAKVTISSGSLAFGARNETIGTTSTAASGLAMSGTGAITMSSGTINIANSAVMTGGTITVTSSGAAFNLNTDFGFSGGTLDVTYTGASSTGFRLRGGDGTGITYSSSGTSTAVISNSGAGSGASLALNNVGINTTVFNIADSASVATEMSISLKITGGDTNALQKTGAGVLVLSGPNTYTGKTSISNGILSVASLNKVSGGATSSNLGAPTTVANGTIDFGSTTTTGQLTYTGTGETTDRVINLAGTTGGRIIDQSGTGLLKFTSDFTATGVGSKTLTLQGSTAGTGEISGKIVDNLTGTNNTSVTKGGTSTWTLSGNNTYSGATTVNGGTLFVSGSLAAGSTVTVSNLGTVLGGAGGTINGSVSIASSGARLQGGTGSTGQTLTMTGAVTMSAGSIIQLALGAPGVLSSIAISGGGTLSFATNQDFNFIDLGATTGTYNGLITGVPDPGVALNSWVITTGGVAASSGTALTARSI